MARAERDRAGSQRLAKATRTAVDSRMPQTMAAMDNKPVGVTTTLLVRENGRSETASSADW